MTSSYYKRIDIMNIRGTNLATCRFEVRCRAMAYGLGFVRRAIQKFNRGKSGINLTNQNTLKTKICLGDTSLGGGDTRNSSLR